MGVIRMILRTVFPFTRKWPGFFQCKEAFPLLSEFMDRELDPRIMRRMKGRLGDCSACQDLLDSLEKVKKICQEEPDRPIPEETSQKILRGLRAEYEKARQQLGEIEKD